ncbi:MAG: hypothetical protein Q4C47_08945, partial [Planctomycetia bacterium]|nr:hypothetical protein [Planctomycetia bacterium]
MEIAPPTIETDPDVDATLNGILRQIGTDPTANENIWRERLDTLLKLSDSSPEAVVELPDVTTESPDVVTEFPFPGAIVSRELSPETPGRTGKLRRFTTLRRRIALILRSLSPDIRELLLRRHGIITHNEIDSLVHSPEMDDDVREQSLLRLAERIPIGDAAVTALTTAGGLAWRRNDTVAARRAWSDAIAVLRETSTESSDRTIPDQNLRETELAFRLVLVSLRENDYQRARREIDAFVARCPMATTPMTVDPSGEIGPSRETLLRDLLTRYTSEQTPPANPSETQMNTEPEFTIRRLVSFDPEKPIFDPYAIHQGIFPICAPDAHGNLVLWWADATSISGVRIADGTPVYESGDSSPTFFRDASLSTRPLSRNALPTDADPLFGGPLVSIPDATPEPLGTPVQVVRVVGNRLVAKIGSPLTSLPSNTETHRRTPDTPLDETTDAAIVILDLAAEGQLIRRITPENLNLSDSGSDATGIAFDGPPAVDSRRVFLTLRERRQEIILTVVALDIDTGELLWRRPLSRGTTPALDDHPEITATSVTTGSHDGNHSTL